MTAVTLNEIERDLTGFLQRVAAGESLLIFKGNDAVAEIKPIGPSSLTPRPVGLCAGEFQVPDDFDAPLPDDILNQFEGS